MAAMQTFILLVSVIVASAQRPFFAGFRPIGYPELLNKTTTTPSGLEDKFGEVTTQRLPIEAGGDRELVDRLSKLPIDKQPFWLINWQALEANREKPQTYPLKPSPFLESTFQNVAPINNPNLNTNTGFVNPNPGFTNPNTGFVNNPGFENPNTGFGNTNTGFVNPNSGFGNSNGGVGNNNPGFSNVNPNPVTSNQGFVGGNPSFLALNAGNTGNANFGNRVQSPNPKGQGTIIGSKNGNSSVENRYGTETTPTAFTNTVTGTSISKTPANSNHDATVVATSTDVNNKDVQGPKSSHEEDEFEDIEVKKFYKNH